MFMCVMFWYQCLAENYNLEFTEAMWLRINFCNQSFLICACYHPPKPKYACTAFITYLDRNIEALLDVPDTAFLISDEIISYRLILTIICIS